MKLSKMRGPNRKKIPASKNYLKLKKKIRKLHYRIKQIRKDWQHKYSMALVKDHNIIVMETLDIQGMRKNKGVSKKDFNDKVLMATWYQLKAFIKYKAEWYGRTLIEVDKYFPSSQLCSTCGQQNQVKMLRRYSCSGCNTVHDGDINAAKDLQTVGYWFESTVEVIKDALGYQCILQEKICREFRDQTPVADWTVRDSRRLNISLRRSKCKQIR